MRSFMFDILQGDMTRSKVILIFTCLKMYIARSGDTSGSRTTLFRLVISDYNQTWIIDALWEPSRYDALRGHMTRSKVIGGQIVTVI